MKVIDLLNKIANGEEVPLIKYRDKILHWNKEKDRFEDKDGMNTLYEMLLELQNEVHTKDKEIERLNNIIEQTQKILYIKLMNENKEKIYIQEVIDIIENLKGSDKE